MDTLGRALLGTAGLAAGTLIIILTSHTDAGVTLAICGIVGAFIIP